MLYHTCKFYWTNVKIIPSEKWNIKFNANKSIVINAGFIMYNDEDIYLFISNNKLEVAKESKYLGLIKNKNNDDN